MQYNITTSLIVSLSENGFGLDELIYRMEELANKKAFPQLLKTIVLLVDENLKLRVMLKQPLPKKCGCTCEQPDLVLDGGMPRKIRTRLGIVELPRITRVKCKHCVKTFVPLALMYGLEKHQTMSNELAKLVLEQCAQESYRVATGNIHEMTAAKESHSTFRRWVLNPRARGDYGGLAWRTLCGRDEVQGHRRGRACLQGRREGPARRTARSAWPSHRRSWPATSSVANGMSTEIFITRCA